MAKTLGEFAAGSVDQVGLFDVGFAVQVLMGQLEHLVFL